MSEIRLKKLREFVEQEAEKYKSISEKIGSFENDRCILDVLKNKEENQMLYVSHINAYMG